MTLAERIMQLKGDTPYTELSSFSGVSAPIISAIANGKRTIDFDDEYQDVKAGELKYLANCCFNMTLGRLMKPVTEFTDNNLISRTRTMINGEWVYVEVRGE